MSGEEERTKGGFHIKARDVKVKAGKDIVAGNQITTTTITTSPNTGPSLKKGKRMGERLATEALSVWTGPQSGDPGWLVPGGSPLASM